MLLTITYTGQETQKLGYLLYKNPGKVQEFRLTLGKAYVFYPELSDERTTAALLLDLDPLDLAKGKEDSGDSGLFAYVNDRPYVNSSFMSTALTRVFGTAMSGRCDPYPELAQSSLDLTVRLSMLPVHGDREVLRRFFEPLGYDVSYETYPVDELYPEWGESAYVDLTLQGKVKLSDLLHELYVLIPALDGQKHYYVSEDEIDKLFSHGKGWLDDHPDRELIVRRYFGKLRAYADKAMDRLTEKDEADEAEKETNRKKHPPLDRTRLETVCEEVVKSGAGSVLDLGCGEGKLMVLLAKRPSIRKVTGMDVSGTALKRAKERLEKMLPQPEESEKLTLLQGSLLYKDERLRGYDTACLVEVIEHIDPEKLPYAEEIVFKTVGAKTIIVTTPNRGYNVNYRELEDGELRHEDHRFEWTEAEFTDWTDRMCKLYGFEARITGIRADPSDPSDYPTQMAIFTRRVDQEPERSAR